jgi:hypothetical protein
MGKRNGKKKWEKEMGKRNGKKKCIINTARLLLFVPQSYTNVIT